MVNPERGPSMGQESGEEEGEEKEEAKTETEGEQEQEQEQERKEGSEELERLKEEYERAKQELKEALQKNSEKITKEDRDKMLKYFDEETSGLVSVKEFGEVEPEKTPIDPAEAEEFDPLQELGEEFDEYFKKKKKYEKAKVESEE